MGLFRRLLASFTPGGKTQPTRAEELPREPNRLARVIDKTSQPIEVLIVNLGAKELTEERAIGLVRGAEIQFYSNVDTGRFGIGGSMVGFAGQIELSGEGIWFGPNSFTNLHRQVYEDDSIVGVPASTVARICLEATNRIRYATGSFSFSNALAYITERDSGRAEAVQFLYPLDEVLEKCRRTGYPMFIEAFVPAMQTVARPESSAVGQVLWEGVKGGKKLGDQTLEYRSWRSLAQYYCEVGDAAGALNHYSEALRCGSTFLEPIPMLILQGDRLWAALEAKAGRTTATCASEIARLAGELPGYQACITLLMRAADLCRLASATAEAEVCLAAARGRDH